MSNFTLTLERGREIFTALGRRTAKNWAHAQLTNAINVGLATIATPETVAAIADKGIVADINAMLKAKSIEVVVAAAVEAPAAKPTKAAKKAPVAPVAAAVEAPAAKPAKAAKKAPVATEAPAAKPTKAAKKAPVAPVVEAPAAKPTKATKAAKKAPVAPVATEAPVEPAKGKKAAKKAAAPVVEAPVVEAPVEPAKGKKAAKKAPVAPAAAPVEPETTHTVGVRYMPGRPFVCGQVLLESGVLDGITPAMVARVDELYTTANTRESMFALRNGWHTLRGYMGWDSAEVMAQSHDITVEEMPVVVGARFGCTRPYFCGVVIAQFGMQNGVTPEMHAAVEACMPDDAKNDKETAFTLRNAWHVLRGYFGVENETDAVARDVERSA